MVKMNHFHSAFILAFSVTTALRPESAATFYIEPSGSQNGSGLPFFVHFGALFESGIDSYNHDMN